MVHDYHFVLMITASALAACAGIIIFGLHRILKLLGIFVPWEAGNPGKTKHMDKKKALEIDVILSNLPKTTGTACKPVKDNRSQGLLYMRPEKWTVISENKNENQVADVLDDEPSDTQIKK